MSKVFFGSRAKVERAVDYIDELRFVLGEFSKEDFYSLEVEKNPETGYERVVFRITQDPWPDLSLIIGDAVHNLSSALDYMTSEIVAAAGIRSDRVTFPMHELREQLVRSTKGGPIEKAAPDILQLIIDVIKPYRAGNYGIWALRKLDNIDKHRLLIPVLNVAGLSGTHLEVGNNVMRDGYMQIRGGQVLAPLGVGGGGHTEIKDKGQACVDILFGQGQLFDNQPVIPTLHQLAQLVTGVIQTLEAHYFGEGPSEAPGGEGDAHGE